MKSEAKYTLNDILKVIQKLPEAEKDFMLKKVSVADILRIYNNKNEYCTLTKTIEDGMAEWKLWKSSVEGLYKELNKYDSDTVYKYANIKVAPEIDGYTFARMVDVVANARQETFSSCCTEVMAIINGLYLIKRYPDNNIKCEDDKKKIEETVSILKSFDVDLDKKVFWILDDIHTKWGTYTLAQQTAIASLIIDGSNTETFLALMENWGKIDNRVPSSDIKAIMSEIKLNEDNKFFGLKDAMIDINNRLTESENFNGFLNSIHEMWNYLDDKQKNNITGNMAYGNYAGLAKAMLDIDESISKMEESRNG